MKFAAKLLHGEMIYYAATAAMPIPSCRNYWIFIRSLPLRTSIASKKYSTGRASRSRQSQRKQPGLTRGIVKPGHLPTFLFQFKQRSSTNLLDLRGWGGNFVLWMLEHSTPGCLDVQMCRRTTSSLGESCHLRRCGLRISDADYLAFPQCVEVDLVQDIPTQ